MPADTPGQIRLQCLLQRIGVIHQPQWIVALATQQRGKPRQGLSGFAHGQIPGSIGFAVRRVGLRFRQPLLQPLAQLVVPAIVDQQP